MIPAVGSSRLDSDLEEMHAAGTLDVGAVVGVLARYLGADDHRLQRLLELG